MKLIDEEEALYKVNEIGWVAWTDLFAFVPCMKRTNRFINVLPLLVC